MKDIFYLILGNLLSIAFRLFICFTKSDTFAVEAFNALIESPKYLSRSLVLLFISGGMLR